ncbi:MAG: DUF4863 family protein [Nannocystis sp.]|nr:DUF4863 family protein [Nannocystis sp.]
MNSNNARDALLSLLDPVLATIAALAPAGCHTPAERAALASALDESFPVDGAVVTAIGEAIERGIAEGWLCDRGEVDARFSRLGKASAASHGLSIDVVRLRGPGARHMHPKGEVTLGFAVEGAPTFEGRPPGWVFMPPGSSHVPEVVGGRMNLIYFLPEGAVSWAAT